MQTLNSYYSHGSYTVSIGVTSPCFKNRPVSLVCIIHIARHMAAKEISSDQQSDSPSSQYTILTLAQLYYVIDEAPKVSQAHTNVFWTETDSLSIEGAKISKVETTWFAVITNKILNRKY